MSYQYIKKHRDKRKLQLTLNNQLMFKLVLWQTGRYVLIWYIRRRNNMARRKLRGTKRPRQAVCRNCGLKQVRSHNDFFHAAVPRCIACGGILDRTFHKTARTPSGETEESSELRKKRLGLRKKKKNKKKKWENEINNLPK